LYVRLTARPVGVVAAIAESGEPVYVCARLLNTTVAGACATVSVVVGVDAEANPLLLVYAAEIVWVPTVRPVSEVVATPLTTLTLIVLLSTVKTTVPAGVTDGPETVALIATDCPYTGDAGEKAPSVIVAVGGTVGPVSTSCTADGVESAAFVRLPLNVAVSVGLAKVVGVKEAVNEQAPPTATEEGSGPARVQSVDPEAVRL
jgi:hypothetical protein